jgi:hypothetical protein
VLERVARIEQFFWSVDFAPVAMELRPVAIADTGLVAEHKMYWHAW